MSNLWDSVSRVSAAQKFRSQSARMGADATRALVEAVAAQPGQRVLDVASGTGEPAISLAEIVGATGQVTACDISPEPLKLAEQRAAKRGLSNFLPQVADVHHLPFPDASFDRVSCRLGLMFFADLDRALREICRVLVPGGRFAALVWGPERQPYFDATLDIIRRYAGTTGSSAAAMFKFAESGTLTRALRTAGFAQAEERLAFIPWNWHGAPAELWEYWQEVTVPFRPLLQQVPQELRASLDESVLSALRMHYDGRQVAFAAQFIIAVANR